MSVSLPVSDCSSKCSVQCGCCTAGHSAARKFEASCPIDGVYVGFGAREIVESCGNSRLRSGTVSITVRGLIVDAARWAEETPRHIGSTLAQIVCASLGLAGAMAATRLYEHKWRL